MRCQPTLILPIAGLLFFALGTYASVRFNRLNRASTGKYFYWSSIRLDADPGNHRNAAPNLCAAQNLCWEPLSVWVDPGWLARTFIVSALPAFLIGRPIVHAFAIFGISEVIPFMILMPVLIFGWFYVLSWAGLRLIQRRRHRKEKLATSH